MYTSSYFTLRHKRSTKMLSKARPRPSQLMRIAADFRRLVNSLLVNCTRLFTVKDRRRGYAQGPIQRFQAETGIQGDRDFPGQHIPTEPIDHRHQVNEPPLEADIRDVTTPDLIAALNAHPPQQIRIALGGCSRYTGVRLRIERFQTHQVQ